MLNIYFNMHFVLILLFNSQNIIIIPINNNIKHILCRQKSQLFFLSLLLNISIILSTSLLFISFLSIICIYYIYYYLNSLNINFLYSVIKKYEYWIDDDFYDGCGIKMIDKKSKTVKFTGLIACARWCRKWINGKYKFYTYITIKNK